MGSAASAAMTAAVNGEDVGEAMTKELEAQANAAVQMAADELEAAVREGQESAFISKFLCFSIYFNL
jgi:Ni,Fe-hydrogenase maturation factor